VVKKGIILKIAKVKKIITQLKKKKNLKGLKNIQLGVLYFVIIIYTKYIKMQNIAQAIGHKN